MRSILYYVINGLIQLQKEGIAEDQAAHCGYWKGQDWMEVLKMLCNNCKYNGGDSILHEYCNGDLHKVESVPDKNGLVVIALKCSGYEKRY